jgi:hypothetical protein
VSISPLRIDVLKVINIWGIAFYCSVCDLENLRIVKGQPRPQCAFSGSDRKKVAVALNEARIENRVDISNNPLIVTPKA